MQGEISIFYTSSRHKLYFADSLGRLSFFKQQYKQMMPQPLQSHPSVSGFYTIFHLFNFWQEEIAGVRDINAFSFVCNYM